MKKSGSSAERTALRQDDRGFTLVELLVSIVILAIVFIPLLHSFVTGAQTELKLRRYDAATAAAQNIIEQMQAAELDALLDKNGASAYTPAGYNAAPRFVKQTVDEDGKPIYVDDLDEPTVTATTAAGKTKLAYSSRTAELDNLQPQTGGSTFKALVTLEQNDSVVGKDVSVNNPADATVDMSGADGAALAALNIACSETSFNSAQMRQYFSRQTTISSHLKNGIYTVEVVFTYTGTVSYTYEYASEDKDGNPITLTASRTVRFTEDGTGSGDNLKPITETAAKTVPAPDDTTAAKLKNKGRAAYSLYLRFDPWYPPKGYSSNSWREEIDIYNYGESELAPANSLDFNVFLADVSGTKASDISAFYQPHIKYHNQCNTNDTRVFTNIPLTNVSIKTYSVIAPGKTAGVSRSLGTRLVEEKQIDRMYNVTVRIFNAGDDPLSAKALVEMKSAKLR